MTMKRCILFILLLAAFSCPAFAAHPPDPDFLILWDDPPPGIDSMEYHRTKRHYEMGNVREAYDQWLEQAWKGDLRAFARLGPLMQAHPDIDWPVPARL